MIHFYDPRTEDTMHRNEVLYPGFIASLELGLGDRRKDCSLKEQQLDDIATIKTGDQTQAFVNVTETRSNGKKKEVCLRMHFSKNTGWSYTRQWCSKADIIVWSGKESIWP